MSHAPSPSSAADDKDLKARIADLTARLEEAEDTLRAIRVGDVDAIVVGNDVYTLDSAGTASNRFRGDVLAQVSDAVIATDLEERVTFINAAAERQYGLRAAEALGCRLGEVYEYRWLRTGDEAAARDALRERGEWRGENIHVTHEGRELHVDSSVTALRGPDGATTGMVATIRDITERKRADEALRVSEERLKIAAEVGRVGIWDWNLVTDTLVWDDAMFALYGSRREDFSGAYAAWAALLHPADKAASEAAAQDALAGRKDYPNQFRVIWPDGSVHHLEAHGRVFRDEAGQPARMIGTNVDITARIRRERNLVFLADLQKVFAPLSAARDIMRVVSERLAEHLGLVHCTLVEVDEAADTCTVLHDHNVPGTPNLAGSYRQSDFHTEEERRVLASGAPQVIADVRDGGRTAARAQLFEALGIRALVNAGYVSGSRWRFVLHASRSQPYAWPAEEVELLTELASRLYVRVERARAEEALRASEQRLELGMRVAGLALAVVDYATGLNHLSEDSARQFGLGETAVAVPRERVHATFHPDDRAVLMPRIAESLDPAGEGWFAMDHRIVWPSGEVRWLRVRKQVLFDGEGSARRPVRAMLATLDITERKLAEQAVARLAAIAESSHDAIFGEDLDGFITSWNPGAEQIFGYRAEEILGTSIMRLMPADGQAAEHELQLKIVAGELGGTVEAIRLTKDGREFPASITIAPLKDAAGKVIGTSRVLRDISRLKQAEEALSRSKRELQALADNTPDILARFDRQLRHVFVNAAVERVTGRAAKEFIGKTHRELGMPVELCDIWDAAITAVFEKGQTVTREFSFEAAAGVRHFSATLIAERGPSGEVVNVLNVTHDRTVEKEALDGLRVADRRKDEFLATLAHELRNPLAPLRNGLQVLKLTKDPATAHRSLLMLERQLGQMVRLIDDLLEVSRITSGKVGLRLERMDLQSAVQAAIEAARPQIDAARQALELEITPEPLWLQADFTRICQVLSNLLTNAAKYSPDGSKIRMRLQREGNEAVVTVADDGEGIPQNRLADVFEMFTQIDRTLDRAQGGLGIGLALVKRLVDIHGGTVTAESAGLGAGSTFTVRLPTLVDAATATMGTDTSWAPLDEQVAATSLRVLGVDDNVDAAESLAALLSIHGHDCRVAHSGEAALAVVREFKPALVLLDIGMPGMNGYETAMRIRAEHPKSPVTLAALTGWGAEADRVKATEAGFDHHFTKPVDPAKVTDVLRLIAQRQANLATGTAAPAG